MDILRTFSEACRRERLFRLWAGDGRSQRHLFEEAELLTIAILVGFVVLVGVAGWLILKRTVRW